MRSPMFRGKGRIVLLLDRMMSIGLTGPVLATAKVNGIALMSLDLRAWGQKFAFYYGHWEPEYIEVSRRLYAGGNFVDVGSSLGLYAVCLGDLVSAAKAKVISVEPLDFNLVRQRVNVSLNGLDDTIIYHQVALGDREDVLKLVSDPERSDNNAFIASDGGTEVRVTLLDTLLEASHPERVGFIKIDVEGFDVMVVMGAVRTIRRDRPVIFAECNRERMEINRFSMAPMWDFLMAENYEAYAMRQGKLARIRDPGREENLFFLQAEDARRIEKSG